LKFSQAREDNGPPILVFMPDFCYNVLEFGSLLYFNISIFISIYAERNPQKYFHKSRAEDPSADRRRDGPC
jgi:hypothetical protein